MKITKCNHCDGKKPADRPEDCFLYCSKECKETAEHAGLEKRQREMTTHRPYQRRSVDENFADYRLIGTSGPVVFSPEYFLELAEKEEQKRLTKAGKVDGRARSNRKCGNCGEAGHNARTCGKQKGYVPASLAHVPHRTVTGSMAEPKPEVVVEGEPEKPSEPAVEPGEPGRGDAPAPRSMEERKREKDRVRASMKGGGRKCGKCGEKGHNARTCGRPADQAPTAKKTGRKNKCGKCGELGHNARSCSKG